MSVYLIIGIIFFGIWLISRIIKLIVENKKGVYAIVTNKDTYIDTGYYETRIDMRKIKERTKFVIYTKNNYYYVTYELFVNINVGDKILIKGGYIEKI